MNKGIPIYIGTSDQPCDKIQEKVLVYTLQKNTKAKLNIHFLRPKNFPKVSAEGWGTPFTGLRYAIPSLEKYKGKAIYMDMDMINFRDIEDFYHINLHNKPFGMCWDANQLNIDDNTRGSFCDSMMLIDCSKTDEFFKWEEVENWKHKTVFKWEFMKRLRHWENVENRKDNMAVCYIDSRWNSFDGSMTDALPNPPTSKDFFDKPQYELDMIFHLHLTALSYQPWHSRYLHAAKASHFRRDVSDYWWELVDEVRSFEI